MLDLLFHRPLPRDRETRPRMFPVKFANAVSAVRNPFFGINLHACTNRHPPSSGTVRA